MQQLFFRRQLALGLWRYLTYQNIARVDEGADADDAVLVEVAQRLGRDVGNVASELLLAELRLADLNLELLDVDRGIGVVFHQLFADDDRVLEVVAVPRHERDQHVAAQGQLALDGRRPVGQHLPLFHLLTDAHDRLLVQASVFIQPGKLAQEILALVHADAEAVHVADGPGPLGPHDHAAVLGHVLFEARGHDRRLGDQQRHRLALHVGTHQRPVGVVVFEERNQARRDADHLLGADVDELHGVGRHRCEVTADAGDDAVFGDLLAVGRAVGRRQVGRRLLVGPQPAHVVRQLLLRHRTIGRDEEAIVVHAGIDAQVRNQADIGAFWGLNRTNTAVVRDVYVAHVEAGSLAIEAARPKGRQAPLMRELRQRVGLVHDLRQFAAAEEVFDGRRDRLGIDERARRHVLLIADAHALLHRSAQLEKALAQLVGRQFVDGAHPAIAEVVDVVDARFALRVAQPQDVADGVEVIERPQGHFRFRNVLIELAVDAEAADFAETVAVGVLELLLEQLARLLQLRRVARAQALVDFEQRFLMGAGRVFLERVQDERISDLRQDRHFLDGACQQHV